MAAIAGVIVLAGAVTAYSFNALSSPEQQETQTAEGQDNQTSHEEESLVQLTTLPQQQPNQDGAGSNKIMNSTIFANNTIITINKPVYKNSTVIYQPVTINIKDCSTTIEQTFKIKDVNRLAIDNDGDIVFGNKKEPQQQQPSSSTNKHSMTIRAARIPSDDWKPKFTDDNAGMFVTVYDLKGKRIKSGYADENGFVVSGLKDSLYFVYPADCTNCRNSGNNIVFQQWEDRSSDRPRLVPSDSDVTVRYKLLVKEKTPMPPAPSQPSPSNSISIKTDKAQYGIGTENLLTYIKATGQVNPDDILVPGGHIVMEVYMPNGTRYLTVDIPGGQTSWSSGSLQYGNFNVNGDGRYEFNFRLAYEDSNPGGFHSMPPAPPGNWTIKATYSGGLASAETKFEILPPDVPPPDTQPQPVPVPEHCDSNRAQESGIATLDYYKRAYTPGENVTVFGYFSKLNLKEKDEDGNARVQFLGPAGFKSGYLYIEAVSSWLSDPIVKSEEQDGCHFTFWHDFSIPETIEPGQWQIVAEFGGVTVEGDFFSVPDGKITVQTDRSHYRLGDNATVTGQVSQDILSSGGNHVVQVDVTHIMSEDDPDHYYLKGDQAYYTGEIIEEGTRKGDWKEYPAFRTISESFNHDGNGTYEYVFNLAKQSYDNFSYSGTWVVTAYYYVDGGDFPLARAEATFEVAEEAEGNETEPAPNAITIDDILFVDSGKWLSRDNPPYTNISLQRGPYDGDDWQPSTSITVTGSIYGNLVPGQPVILEVYRPDGRLSGTYELYESTDKRTPPGGPRIDTEPGTDGTYFYRHKHIPIGYDSAEDALAQTDHIWTVVARYGQASDEITFEVAITGGTGPAPNLIEGTEGNDFLNGTDDVDEIRGHAGNDTIHGLAGDDRIFGGRGNDLLVGDGGSDYIEDSFGSNRIYGSAGDETIKVDISNASGSASYDDLTCVYGQEGNDTINVKSFTYVYAYGGPDDDRINIDGYPLTPEHKEALAMM